MSDRSYELQITFAAQAYRLTLRTLVAGLALCRPVYGFKSTRQGSLLDDYGPSMSIGPGVTPDVSITVAGLHNYDTNNSDDVAYEQRQNALQASVVAGDTKCNVR